MNKGEIIFLSASVPSREGWKENAQPAEIEEAIVSIARAVFARKGRLLFGGHPSVSPLIAAVAGEYFAAEPTRAERPVITFQSKHFEGMLPDETWEMVRMGWSAIQWTPRVPGSDGKSDERASLKKMREWMLLASDTPHDIVSKHRLELPKAMIAVGGMEGVRDEAAIFLRNRRKSGLVPAPRVYVFGSGGGAAARLLEPGGWRDRLWLGKNPDLRDLETLESAWRQGDIVDVETQWSHENGGRLAADIPFQPYAAMAQWLIDTQLIQTG